MTLANHRVYRDLAARFAPRSLMRRLQLLAVAPKHADRQGAVFLNAYGIAARVTTPLADFADFVRRNYRAFLDGPGANFCVRVTFSPEAGAHAAEVGRRLRDAGMGIRLDRTRLYWENEFGFRVLLTLTDAGAFELSAFHHDLERAGDVAARQRNFQRSLRWAVHFPIFVQLRARFGWTLAHASAVVREGRAAALCGLNKVGKSTLAMYLCRNHNFRFMTDNFLLCASDAVYGFPEVLRLGPQSLRCLGMEAPPNQAPVYGKHHLSLNPSDICLKGLPQAFFLITLGERVELTPLDPGDARRRLGGLHAFLGEFPEHSYLAMLSFLDGAVRDRHARPPADPAPAKWYQLVYPLNWHLEDIAEVVEGCI